MSENRKIDDFSVDKENAEYRASEMNEAGERAAGMMDELELAIASFNAEADSEKKLVLEAKITRLQHAIDALINYGKRSVVDYDRSVARHEFRRQALLKWKPENVWKN